jgi:hypothetical protein
MGMDEVDASGIGIVLDTLFNVRCTPPLTPDSGVPSFMVGTQSSICTAPSCPVADPTYCPSRALQVDERIAMGGGAGDLTEDVRAFESHNHSSSANAMTVRLIIAILALLGGLLFVI